MRGWPSLLAIWLLLATLGVAQAKLQFERGDEPAQVQAREETGVQIAQRRGGFSAPSFRPSPPVYRAPAPSYRPPSPSYQSPAPTFRPQVTTPALRQPAFRPQVVIPPPGRVAAPSRNFGQPQVNMPRLVPRVGGSSLGDRMAARVQQGLSGRLAGRGTLGLQATRANRIAITVIRPNVPMALGVRSTRSGTPANSVSLRGRFATAASIGLASATGSKVMAGSTGGSGGRCDRSHPDYPRCAASNDSRNNPPPRRIDMIGERGNFQVWATGKNTLVGQFQSSSSTPRLQGLSGMKLRESAITNVVIRTSIARLEGTALNKKHATNDLSARFTFDKNKGVYISPEGIIYGIDRKFGNSMKHIVENHVKLKDDRKTKFAINRSQVFALIDDAYRRRGRPEVGDPQAYVIKTGVIGTHGEDHIKLVFSKYDSNSIVTAYPCKLPCDRNFRL